MSTARVAGEPRLSIFSMDTNLAGSTRSGKQRLLPDQAGTSDSESADPTASRSLSETTAGTQVVAVGGDCDPLDIEAVDQSLMNSDQEGAGEIMSAESEAAAAKAAAELAAAQAGGGDNDVEIIEPSPTNLDPNKMPKTVESNVFTCAKIHAYSSRVRISKLLVQCDSKVKDLEELEDERGEED